MLSFRFLVRYLLIGTTFALALIIIFTILWLGNTKRREELPQTRDSSLQCAKAKIDPGLVQRLRRHAQKLIETQRSLAPGSAGVYHKLGQHIQDILGVLKTLDDTTAHSKSNIHATDDAQKQEVCPEKYAGGRLNYGYPFFRKGFESVKCVHFVPIHQLVTVLISMPQELPKPAENYVGIMKGVAKYYPQIRVILATDKTIEESTKSSISNLNITFENEIIDGVYQSTLWKRLVEKVETPYVLIAPHLTHFDDDINLERLVRVLSYDPQVAIAGGSYRNLTGHWDIGCQQVSFRNWTATYKGGYYHSFNECIVCDFLTGPWMAKTSTLKDLDFDRSLKYGAFHDLFWRLKKTKVGKITASCPDVMFNVNTRDVKDEEYVEFANKHSIHKMVEANGRVRWYGCRRGYPYTSGSLCTKKKGMALSPSDMENLADAVKFVMRECENAGIFCEIQDGTLMGAVKFNGVLPWERDADIVFQTSDFSALEKLQSRFTQAGYRLVPERSFKTINGLPHGGYFGLGTTNWRLELWGYSVFDTLILTASGQRPTKVLFAGEWVNHPRNPGLFARNRYGPGIYQHQEHWGTLGFGSGWSFYSPGKFSTCPEPGHSACLDQYPADGNMQFSDYCA